MKRIKKNIAVMLTVILLAAFSAPMDIEAKGVRSGGMQKGAQGVRQSEAGIKERGQIHSVDRQRDQLKICTQSAEQVRTRARNMEESAGKAGFNTGQARRECTQLRKEIQVMTREHERFMQGLSDEQKTRFQNRISNMDQSRNRVMTSMQEMDNELNKNTDPHPDRVAGHAKAMHQAMHEWQKEYRYLESERNE
jgi:hypothetical protein